MSDQTLEERLLAEADDLERNVPKDRPAFVGGLVARIRRIANEVGALAIRASCLTKAEKMEGRKMLAAIAKLEETNKRLNRRCQSAESGLAEKIDAAYRLAPNLGRALANSAAKMYGHRVEKLEAALGLVVEVLGNHYCGVCGNAGDGEDQPYHAVTEAETCDGCRGNWQAWRAGKDLLDA